MTDLRRANRLKILTEIHKLSNMKLVILDITPSYMEHHPEIGDQLKVIYQLIDQLEDILTSFRDNY